ncbi:hypothetical protein ABTF01_21390, partial [Acinetobacter baumannii]
QAVGQILRQADLQTRLHGKDVLPMAGEYTPVVMARGLAAFLARHDIDHAGLGDWLGRIDAQARALAQTGVPALPPRQPTFCT